MDESAQTKTTQETNGSTGGKWNPIELVMIHGVGDPKPGDLLQEYCEGKCAAGQPSQARVERLQLGDTEYAVLIPDVLFLGKQKVSEMVEVNWADVQRPSQGKLGVFGHALMLCFALRNLSLDPDRNPSQIARWATLAYWLLVEGAAIWIALRSI